MLKVVARLVSSAREELKAKQLLFHYQLLSVCLLLLAGGVVFITEWLNPEFFNFPYFKLNVRWDDILRFWPLFLYAAIMAYLSSIKLVSSNHDAKILKWDLITSVMAGLWEELGFRWLFICTSMIVIVVTNWLFGSFLGTILGIGVVVMGLIVLIAGKSLSRLKGLVTIALGCLLAWASIGADPMFWIYDHVTVPIASLVTFGQFGNIFYSTDYPKLFIFGMVAANARFRDGHKYQGLVGVINAWIVGFIFMGAMINYGIGTAIFIHAFYDIEFGIIHYIFRKTDVL